MDQMSTEMSRMGCQYEYMMRMSQPGSPCPDDNTIKAVVRYHDYMMTEYVQEMEMCSGMDRMSNALVSTYYLLYVNYTHTCTHVCKQNLHLLLYTYTHNQTSKTRPPVH